MVMEPPRVLGWGIPKIVDDDARVIQLMLSVVRVKVKVSDKKILSLLTPC